MHFAVYLPLLFPVLAAPAARPLAERLHPRLATWLLTTAAVVLAACSTAVLGVLALAGLLRIELIASLGGLSSPVIGRGDPISSRVDLVAALLLAAAAAATARMVWRRGHALYAAALEAACFPGSDPVVVMDDEAADAFAMPGLPGRIVVSTAMLDALNVAERQALLDHERAHLRGHHYLFTALVQMAATANPLLRPVATAVAFTVERWADEHAAAVCGDRRRVARAVGKAALAAKHTSRRRLPAIALGLLGRDRTSPTRAAGGPVPRRVAALLAPPPGNPSVLLLGAAALVASTMLCAAEAAHDLHQLLELAKTH